MRILARFSAAFALGIFLAQYVLPDSVLIPIALVILAVAWLSLLLPQRIQKTCFLVSLGLSIALGWNWFYVRQVQRPMEAIAGTEQSVELVLCAYPIEINTGAKVTVKVNGFPYGKAVYYGNSTLLKLRPGQVIHDTVRFQSAATIKEEEVNSFTSKGIYLMAFHGKYPWYTQGTSDQIRWWPIRFSKTMQTEIQHLFKGDQAAFITSILTGDRSMLSDQAAADLSEAGLSHVLAVSGMHCSFLFAVLIFLIGKQHQKLLAFLSIPVLVFYAALTGGSPSVLRACTMLSLFILAPLFHRESDGWTSLFFALALILLRNPFAIASVSLQLSFGAMAGILLVSSRLYELFKGSQKHDKAFYFIVAGFSTTMGALIFTVPLCGLYFNTLSLVSPVSNLLCLSVASIVFILGLLSVLLGLVCPLLAGVVAMIPGVLAQYILEVAHVLASLPYHAVYFNNPYLKYWLGFTYLLFAVVWISRRKRTGTYVITAFLSALTLFMTTVAGRLGYCADLDAMLLDVNQGQCVLMASQGQFILMDCGSAQIWRDPGKKAADQLRTMGCRKLDYLLLTHYDYDHVSGVSGLMARLPVDTLLLPAAEDDAGLRDSVLEIAALHGTAVQEVGCMEQLGLGAARLTVYPPLGASKDNDRGLSCLVSLDDQDILVTGDMSAATEKVLVSAYELPDVELLVASHHGSKSSTCNEFLDAIQPETVLISAGKNNRYGHPAEEVLRRLAKHHCTIYRTDLHGDIHFILNQGDQNGVQEENGHQ